VAATQNSPRNRAIAQHKWWTVPGRWPAGIRRAAVKLFGAARFRHLKAVFSLLRAACSAWLADNAASMGAALAFYTIFSLVPVFVIATAVAGLFFGQHAAQGEILLQLESVFGRTGADVVHTLIQSNSGPALGWAASTVGILTLLVGASGAFVELQDGLNKIWKVAPTSEARLLGVLRQRFFSLGLVLGLGFLLMVSLVLNAGLHAVGMLVKGMLTGPAIVVNSVNGLISCAVIAVLLMVIYRFLPNTAVQWSDVWLGAVTASMLFTGGKALIGLYLGQSTVASAYGAAGSLVILLVWIYYSAQILLLGAEVTHVYANRHGSRSASLGAGAVT
jgi:membrane protein